MYSVIKVESIDWEKMSEEAHLICFNEIRPKSCNRIDYTLMVVDTRTDKPVSYITVKEYDDETVYWQHGGSFPGSTGIPAWKAYNLCIDWSKGFYKRIFTLIENVNVPMLKMAMKAGFRIIGTKTISNGIMVEHYLGLGD